MKFSDLKPMLIASMDAGVNVEIQSAPGTGKSEFAQDLIPFLSKRDGIEWGLVILPAATAQLSDVLGFLTPERKRTTVLGPNNEEVHIERKLSSFTEPTWMTTVDNRWVGEFKRGILIIEEYGQAEGDVKRGTAELVYTGALGPHKLPKGWSVIALSNRAKDRSGVTKSFDFVINRRVEVEVTPDVNEWIDWANKRKREDRILPVTMAFAKQHPHIVFAGAVPDKQGPWCTPRSLVLADKILRQRANADQDNLAAAKIPDDPATVEFVTGMVGQGAATELFTFVRLQNEMPAFEDIVADPMNAKLPEKPDARMLVAYNLAHRVDLKTIAPVAQYIGRLPKEFAVTFGTSAVGRTPAIVASKTMQDWIAKNAALMTALRKMGAVS